MAIQQAIARPPAPSGGVVHVNIRHSSGFTVVGNHLSQHPELSLAARGLAVHIQSLPPGARISIRALAERLPVDGEARIASALRELEEHGYLKRTRERGRDGRVVTRTVSYNHPDAAAHGEEQQRKERPLKPRPAPAPEPAPARTAQKPPPPPQPRDPKPPLLHAAASLLAGLRGQNVQLALTEADIAYLTPAVAAWFERGATPAAVRHALTSDLPQPVRFPAKLVRHRLTASLPAAAPLTTAYRPLPFQNCEDCERAFRAADPGRCGECEESRAAIQGDNPPLATLNI